MSEDTIAKLREDIQDQAMDLHKAALDEDPGTIERRHNSLGAAIRRLEEETLDGRQEGAGRVC